jgi:hypothetical protein
MTTAGHAAYSNNQDSNQEVVYENADPPIYAEVTKSLKKGIWLSIIIEKFRASILIFSRRED